MRTACARHTPTPRALELAGTGLWGFETGRPGVGPPVQFCSRSLATSAGVMLEGLAPNRAVT